MSNQRFAVIRTSSYNGSFRNAVDGVQEPTPEGMTYFVRRIGKDRARSTYGIERVTVYGVIDGERTSNHKPLTWATREAAEAVAAKHTTDYTTYAVLPLDVVHEADARHWGAVDTAAEVAAATPNAWIETKGNRTRVLVPAKPVTGGFEGEMTEGDVIVSAADWTLIQTVIRGVIANEMTDKPTIERLSAMKVSTVEVSA